VFPPGQVALYFVVYFSLAVVTSGLAVPGGLFLPFIIMGGCVGRYAGIVLKVFFPHSSIDPGTYALVGTAALITGATRMTVSIGVIILELTNGTPFKNPNPNPQIFPF
jgi:chloride channel 7